MNDYIFTLSITPSRKLKTVIGSGDFELSTPLSLGKWATVYVSYAFTAGGYGISRVFLNGVSDDGFASITAGLAPSDFSFSDMLQVGGNFVGSIRRFQIFTSASLELVTGDCIFF